MRELWRQANFNTIKEPAMTSAAVESVKNLKGKPGIEEGASTTLAATLNPALNCKHSSGRLGVHMVNILLRSSRKAPGNFPN